MDIIVHIINADRFTSDYINFMKIDMMQYRHYFIFLNNYRIELVNNKNVYSISSYKEIYKSYKIRNILKRAKKVIISGVFNIDFYYCLFPKEILSKTYLHFWGGDFYQFQGKINIKKRIHKIIMYYLISKSNSCIFLINDDAKKFNDIFHISKKYYVACMPDNPSEKTNYQEILMNNKEIEHRIIVGNSATKTNNHHEVFRYLQKYLKIYKDIEVLCPLVYGDESYKDEVIKDGKKLLGKSFIPILEAMNYYEYASVLATCSIGIFNNNRQQGMGNITTLLYFGKKVYIRDDTTMWDTYFQRGYHLYSFNKLINSNDFSLFDIDENIRERNIFVGNEYEKQYEYNAVCQWSKVLNS